MTQTAQLSNREWEVAQLLLEGKSNKMIALSLGVSERTVEFHLKNIYAKVQVSSRIELVLILRKSLDGNKTEKLGKSTVAGKAEAIENTDSSNLSNWAASLSNGFTKIGKALKTNFFTNSTNHNGGNPMTYFESIRTCFIKYADFNGRASRPEFWWFALFVTLLASALMYIHETLSSIFLIGVLLPFLAAGARRLRDSGKSAWSQLYLLIPVGGIIILCFYWASPPTNPLPEDTPSA